MNRKATLFSVLAMSSGLTLAASVPNTFTPNTPAVAAEVNANFAALVNAVSILENRVDALEGPVTAAALAGNYRMINVGLAMEADQTNTTPYFAVHHRTYDDGSLLTIYGDGTYVNEDITQKIDILDNSTGALRIRTDIEIVGSAGPGTYAITGRTVVFDGSTEFVAVSPSLLIRTSSRDGDRFNGNNAYRERDLTLMIRID